MPNSTKRQRDRRLDHVEQVVQSATHDVEDDWTVEHREAAPSTRPDGMSSDASERVLRYDFWAAQQECLNLLEAGEHDIVGFLGGYRSGKTVAGARWLLTEALANPGVRFLAMGTTYSEAVGTTYRALFEQLPGGDKTALLTSGFNGPEHSPIVADYNRSENRLTLVNDSVIVLGSADKWSRYAGEEFGAAWLDEPSHYGNDLHDLLEMVSTRLTASSGSKVQFWTLTGNGFNTAWEVLEKQEDVDGEQLGHTVELVRASVLENPYVDAADKERLERQFEGGGREQQALHGGFVAAKDLVYGSFSRESHVIEHAEARELVESDWRMYGYDAGWNDPRVLLEIGKTAYDQLVVLDEFHRSECHVEDVINWLSSLGKPSGTIYSEHVPDEIQKFRQAGRQARKADKDVDSGIANVRQRFDSDSDGRPGLLVSDRCEQLIRELHGYKEEHVGASNADDHCCDSLRYAIHTDGRSPEIRRVTPSSPKKRSILPSSNDEW